MQARACRESLSQGDTCPTIAKSGGNRGCSGILVEVADIAHVVDVVAEFVVRSDVANEIGAKHAAFPQLALETDVHLKGSRAAVIGTEEAVRKGRCAAFEQCRQIVGVGEGRVCRERSLISMLERNDCRCGGANGASADARSEFVGRAIPEADGEWRAL